MPGHADPREALIRAAFKVAQAVNGIASSNNARLLALFDEIAAAIARIDPTAVGPRRYRDARIQKLLEEVERLTDEAYIDWTKAIRSDLARLGRVEGLQVQADLIASLGPMGDVVKKAAPTVNMMKAVLDSSVFGDIERGMETLQGWSGVQEQATLRRVRQQLQLGLLNEESIDQIIRRVRGKSNGRGGFRGGVAEVTTRQATTLVRTAATHVSAEARMLTFRENTRVIESVELVTALDSRVCLVCGAHSGDTWPLDSDAILRPPLHLGCRCTLAPRVHWSAIGMDPPEPGMRAARDEDGKRIEVSAEWDFDDWLRSQPATVQRDVLGPARAKLFRDGKVRIDELVGRENRILTLNELEASL